MYILVTFENLDSEETKATLQHLHGIPNGTFLVHPCFRTVIYEMFGHKYGMWWMDATVLNRFYGGILNAFNMIIKNYPGVKTIDVLPFDDDMNVMNDEEHNAFGMKICDYIKSTFESTL